jgi:hypothetical protein
MRRGWLVGILLCGAAVADAAVLCQRPNGDLALREQCRPRERVVEGATPDAGTTGERGAEGTRGGPRDRRLAPLHRMELSALGPLTLGR